MDEGCIVCGSHGVANVGCLFAKGRVVRRDDGFYDLPHIPQLPVCNEHVAWDRAKLLPYAKKRMEQHEG